KEILQARKQQQQTRQVRLAVIGIAALLGVVLLIGIVNELVLKPGSPVADVNGEEIVMQEWQERVRFQRAQLIVGIEDLAEAIGQDIGQVQQFAGQQINLLEDPETLGQLVLDQMIDEIIVHEAASERGIVISDDDVQREIEQSFSYFEGQSPTPLPSATETIMPTPSLTPIPTAVITELLPTSTPLPTATSGPTATPLPTSTPVSLDSFEESFGETINRFDDLGAGEAIFREVVRAQLYRDRLLEALAGEEEMAEEADQVSFFYITSETMEEAEEALGEIESGDYLTVWNTIRSQPFDPESESSLVASELLWRPREDVVSFFGEDVAESAFELGMDEPSGVILVAAEADGESDSYYIIMVSGRELRPLSESALAAAEQELFQSWLEDHRAAGVEIFERWRASVPGRPILDRRFLIPPTPAPPTPTLDIPTIEPESPVEDG
ncbi:MAG: SurA N-terminal domain-containing protein, partial [Chloroflexota bacterium]